MAHAFSSAPSIAVSASFPRLPRLGGSRPVRAAPATRGFARLSPIAVAPDGNNPIDATAGAAKNAAKTVSDKARSFWNSEVMGAKRAMERNARDDAPGKDARASLDVTLEEAVLGTKRPVSYVRRVACATCDGAGRLPQTFIDCDACGAEGMVSKDAEVTVTVPAGVVDGSTLRLKAQGDEGSPAGDLYVTVRAANMTAGAGIRRDGADLITRGVVVRFPERGEPTTVRVRTIEGEWGNLKVDPGANVGQGLRIAGRGAPKKIGGDERGDHLFIIEDVVYEAENERARREQPDE